MAAKWPDIQKSISNLASIVGWNAWLLIKYNTQSCLYIDDVTMADSLCCMTTWCSDSLFVLTQCWLKYLMSWLSVLPMTHAVLNIFFSYCQIWWCLNEVAIVKWPYINESQWRRLKLLIVMKYYSAWRGYWRINHVSNGAAGLLTWSRNAAAIGWRGARKQKAWSAVIIGVAAWPMAAAALYVLIPIHYGTCYVIHYDTWYLCSFYSVDEAVLHYLFCDTIDDSKRTCFCWFQCSSTVSLWYEGSIDDSDTMGSSLLIVTSVIYSWYSDGCSCNLDDVPRYHSFGTDDDDFILRLQYWYRYSILTIISWNISPMMLMPLPSRYLPGSIHSLISPVLSDCWWPAICWWRSADDYSVIHW